MSDTALDLKKIATGLPNFLRLAIRDHKRRNYGDRPQRFVLHPEVMFSLLSDPEFRMWHRFDQTQHTFEGVLLEEDVLATRPKMITVKNEVEYL